MQLTFNNSLQSDSLNRRYVLPTYIQYVGKTYLYMNVYGIPYTYTMDNDNEFINHLKNPKIKSIMIQSKEIKAVEMAFVVI